MSEPPERRAPDLLARLAALRNWASAPSRRRVVYVLAVAVFVGSTVAAWRSLPPGRDDLDWRLIGLAALLGIPGSYVNAEEYRVSGAVLGQRIALAAALRVAILAALFNLLPVPGSVLVRTTALAKGGSTTGRAVTSTAAVGLAYIGVALVLVGAVVAPASVFSGAALAVVGVCSVAGAALLVRRLAGRGTAPLLRRLVLVEAASVVVKAVRLFLVIAALGLDATFAQATSLSLSTVAASAIGIFPGGLGIREVLAGLISPAVGLPASVGLVGMAFDRVVGLSTLSVLATIVLAVTRRTVPEPHPTPDAG